MMFDVALAAAAWSRSFAQLQRGRSTLHRLPPNARFGRRSRWTFHQDGRHWRELLCFRALLIGARSLHASALFGLGFRPLTVIDRDLAHCRKHLSRHETDGYYAQHRAHGSVLQPQK